MAQPVHNLLTPETLQMLQAIAREGSLAGASRALNLVPSAVTYRVRQLEEGLDVLLFDRSARKATLTAAGQELLAEAEHILPQLEAVAQRVKRVATGWEPKLVIAADGLILQRTLFELCEAFFALNPPTQIKIQREILTGTWDALAEGQADIALGLNAEQAPLAGINTKPMGEVSFVFAVAPHHALAQAQEPLSETTLAQHRAVAVADSTRRGRSVSIGLLNGQSVLTVSDIQAKLDAQLLGLGSGFVPLNLAQPYIDEGKLIVKQTERAARVAKLSYAWRVGQIARNKPQNKQPGRALQWWLDQLANTTTRHALLHAPAGRKISVV